MNTTLMTVSETTDYVGNVIYENGALKRILTDNGHIEGNIYYFYVRDHLGNNRVTAKADGTLVQATHFYPFGSSFAVAIGSNIQPYKYGGKELDVMHGVNLYDYSARQKDDWRFITMDPLAEKYYSWSPYAYCANNPMKFIDPTGREWKTTADKEYANSLSQAMTTRKDAEWKNADNKYADYKKALGDGNKEKAAKIENEMKGIGANITSMENGISELAAMGETKDQTFTFNKITGNVGGTEKTSDGVITMDTSGNGALDNGIHEASHGYDIWKSGNIC